MEQFPKFYVNLIDGPTVDELEAAIDAIYRADHPRRPTCAEINAAAIARGEKPPYRWDDDIQLRYVTLMPATLRFVYRGEFIKRSLTVHATKIKFDGAYYNIECHQTFMYRRTLVSNTNEIIRLYARISYVFTIRYNSKIRGGRITSIGRSPEADDPIE